MSEQSESDLTRREFITASAAAAAALAVQLSPLAASAAGTEESMKPRSPTTQSKNVKTITVRQNAGLTDAPIQQAIDELAASGGGVVEVPAGLYLMHDALHLRTGVHVRGEKGTILRKAPSITCLLRGGIGFAQADFAVQTPDVLRVGMGVLLTDKNGGGHYDTVGTIIARQGDRFILSRPARHDYNQDGQASVTSIFPLVEGFGVTDAGIESVQLDGSEETRTINGCVGGGIFLFDAQRILAKGVEVSNWKGDSISIQKCVDVFIRACDVHHGTGIGLHPGTGTVRYVFDGNHLHDNQATGLFFCMNTKFSLVRGNTIENNGLLGIQVNERDSDHWIEGNVIRNNGWAGIGFNVWEQRSGDRIQFQGNTLSGNCTKEGSAEILIRPAVRDIRIIDNKIEPTGKNKAMALVAQDCAEVYCAGNTVSGRAMGKDDVSGQPELVKFAAPGAPLAVRPGDMPLDGALHLGVKDLAAFADRQ